MNREKQIEDISNILWHIPNNYFLNSYNDCERIAECIYDDGGYRKQSEGRWIFAGDGIIQCTSCEEVYDARAWPRNYCPNCGAKMGGKEKT